MGDAAAPRVRLVAVRLAGAALDGPCDLRSRVLAAELPAYARATDAVREHGRVVADLLHAVVPTVDAPTRRRLLAWRRLAHAGSPIDLSAPPALPHEVAAAITRYSASHAECARLGARLDGALEIERRHRWRTLLRDPVLRAVVRYASPLADTALRRPAPRSVPDRLRLERTITGYAAKLVSKCNPLHLFAGLALVDGHGWSCTSPVVELLTPVDAPATVGWTLAPLVAEDDEHDALLLRREGRVAVARVPHHPVISALRAVTSPDDRRLDAARVAAALDRIGAPSSDEAVERTTRQLVGHGVLAVETAPRLATRWIGRRAAIRGRYEGEHWLNAYDAAPRPDAGACALVRVHAADVGAVAAAVTPLDTLSERRTVIAAWLAAELGRRGGCASFPVLVAEFLRVLPSLSAWAEGLEAVHAVRAARERHRAWGSALSGVIDAAALAAPAPARALPVAIVAPVDPVTATVYPTQYFAGDGRFTGRFGVARRQPPTDDAHDADGAWRVDLVVPAPPYLHRVAPRAACGTGFPGAPRHGHRTWIEPEMLEATLDERGTVWWRHRRTHRRLRIRYVGGALSEFLGPEHALLLLDQVDRFIDPFARRTIDDTTPGYRAGLAIGTVVVRRPSWRLSVAALVAVLPAVPVTARDFLAVRRGVAEATGCEATEWYVRLPVAGDRRDAHKPRHLDLLAPASVRAFAHAIRQVPADAVTDWSPMTPDRDAVRAGRTGGRVSEYVLELDA